MANSSIEISVKHARKLVLHAQRLPSTKQQSNPIDSTLAAIEHLGYIQIDTISAIERAHHHTLWNRNPQYTTQHIDELVKNKKVFEYWSHAAAYLPMRHYRYSLPRKIAIKSGDEKHWFSHDKKRMNYVLKRIESEGPLMAKDFDKNTVKLNDWGTKPAKQALENLFMQGDLMIRSRKKFHKVYDLTERVIPEHCDTSIPSKEEHLHFLIKQFLKANALGQASEIAYLLKNTKPNVVKALDTMLEAKELIEVKVAQQNFFSLPNTMELLKKPLLSKKVKILSPFDNLLIQRKRMKTLFNFDYQIECYVPEAKRVYGYFSLPLLFETTFAGRMDCKADRKQHILHIKHLAFEEDFSPNDIFLDAFVKELKAFMDFNQCYEIILHKTRPPQLQIAVQQSINKL